MKKNLLFLVLMCSSLLGTNAFAQYCTTGLYTTGCSVGDEISGVSIGTFSKLSTGCPSGAVGFSDYTTDTILAEQTVSQPFSLITSYGCCEYFAIWIDANDDGDFDDTGEFLFGASSANTGSNVPVTGNFTLPTTVGLGSHRLRVRLNYNTAMTATNSCTSFTYGEVEDYTIKVLPPPSCPAPYALTLTGLSASTATIGWTSTGSSFSIEYGPAGFAKGTGISSTTTTNSTTFTGLTPNTTYDVYVQNNCTAGGNGLSLWSGKFTFTTPCVVVSSFPYAENFDGSTWNTSTGQIDACWSQSNGSFTWLPHTGTTTSTFTGPSGAHSGNNYIYTEASSGVMGDSAIITLPALDLSSLTAPLLSYYFHRYGADMGDLLLQASLDSGKTWTTVYTMTGQVQTATTDAWQEDLVDITAYKSAYTYLRFVGIRGATYDGDMSLDDVNIAEAPPCPKPTAVSFSNLTSSTATLNFLSSGTSFPFEYGPVGFTQGTGATDTASATGHVITGLYANTTYDLYIKNDCSVAGNGLSVWAGPFKFTTLCSSMMEGYTNNFDALTSTDKDPCWNDISFGGAHTVYAYTPSSFSAVQAASSPNVYYWYNAGSANSFVITPELNGLDGDTTQIKFKMANNSGTTNVSVYLGTMSDNSDTSTITWFDTILPATSMWTSYTKLLTNVPAGDKFVVFGRVSTPLYVEIDLDDFVFEGIPSCLPATNVASAALSSSSGMVSWTGTGTFDVEYGPSGFTQGTGLTITGATNPDTLTGLYANTCYDVYVRQDCGSGSYSPWELTTFCTPCNASAMPYTEDFDTWPPSCFTFTKTGTWDWKANSGHAEGDFWSNASGSAMMTSGPVTISQKAQVKFKWAHLYNSSYPDRMVVRSRVLGGQWDTLVDLSGAAFNSPNAQNTAPPAIADFASELIYLDSATYVGNDAEVQFVAISGYGPDLYVDDFVIEAVPSCPEPTQVSATNIQGYQADINWVSAGGSQFVIEYGLQGFSQGTGGGILDTVSGSPATLAGLTPVTCYDYYIMALCGANGSSSWVGPYSFCTTVSCPASTNISATSLTTTTATIDWTSGGASHYDYIVGPAGTTPATGTVVTGNTTIPVTINSLTPSTQYVFWVRDSCGQGDVSTWAGPYNFSTLCNAFPLNYQSNFASWTPPNAPLCWDDQGGSQTVLKSGNTAQFNFWSWINGEDSYLTSPAVSISQKARLVISWSSTLYSFSQDTVLIYAKPTTATSWDLIDTWAQPDCNCGATNTAPSTTPVDSIYTLDSNYVGSDIQVRIVGKSDYGNDVFIHSVKVEADPAFATCPPPTTLTATSITSSSATLGWTGSGSNYEVEYGLGGFAVGSGTVMSATSNSLNITGLNASSNYCFYVREICAVGDTSFRTGPYCFNTACGNVMAPWSESFSTGATEPQCWTNSNVQGDASIYAFWRNTSLNWGNYGAQGIVDHTGGASYAMGVDASTPYNVDVELVTPPIDISALTTPTLSFWIYMNNTNLPGAHNDFQIDLFDGTSWNDSIFGYAADSSDWVQVNVPLSGYTITGALQIRFAVHKVGSPVDFYDDLMIDDVAINDGAGGCPSPTNAMAQNITCDAMDIEWTSDAGTVQTGMVWDTAGFNPLTGGNIILSASSPESITGLTPGTAYDFYIIDSCSAGLSAPIMVNATTASGPLPTLSFTSMQVDTTATTADWEFDATASTDYTSITWEFGDGSANGTNAMETHTYNANQPYTVTVTLTNGCGSVDSSFAVNVQGISIEESALGRTLNIFPNPSSGNVNVTFSVPTQQKVAVIVTNVVGARVAVRELGRVSGEQNVQLDLSQNASGIYLVQIVTDSGTITKRVTLSTK